MAHFFDQRIARPLLSGVPDRIRPNHFTFIRVILVVPVIVWRDTPWLALSVLFLSSVFDILDGPLARIRRQTSESGASFDAASDKVFILGALFLACGDRVQLWLKIAILAFEIVLMLIRPLKRWRNVTAKSNRWGAAKTWTQSIAIAFVLTRQPFLASVAASAAFALGIGLAFLSLVFHLLDFRTRHQ